jgi:hypothetical protein
MWRCVQCGEEIEDQFDSCWKCARQPALKCLRCQAALKFQGRKRWLEDTILHHVLRADLYICPQCGHIEQFAAGIGEEARQELQQL